MAAKGAHIAGNVLARPSIFEVIAQESLGRIIHPAVKKVCEVLAANNPGKYGFLVKWFEELYVVVDWLLQRHYLRRKGASFSESFYGLQRISVDALDASSLSKHKQQLSLVCLVLLPYLRRKCESLVIKYKLEEADGIEETGKLPKGTRGFVVRLYSIYHFVWESIVLYQYFAYLSGNSVHHSPILRALQVALVYGPMISEESPWSMLSQCIASRNFRSIPMVVLGTIGSFMGHSAEIAAFFLQFLQYWYSENKETNLSALPLPPVPQVSVEAAAFKNVCPICLEDWKIPTVLPVSGYIFCYRCISRHVEQTGICPVTKYPVQIEDLVRLYCVK